MTIIEYCPCGMRRDPEYRFCGWCQRDLMRHDDSTCYECGGPIKEGRAVPPITERFKRIYREVMCG